MHLHPSRGFSKQMAVNIWRAYGRMTFTGDFYGKSRNALETDPAAMSLHRGSWASSSHQIQYELAKGIRLPIEVQASATILEVDVKPRSEAIFGEVSNGVLVLKALSKEVTIDFKSASSSYHFDIDDLRDSREENRAFTCVLIARWSLGITDMGSRWVGLILSKSSTERDSYQRVGLLNGPAYEEDLLGWERRVLTIF